MSALYLLLKWLHVVSSTVLLGTGAGIAFFFVRANRTKDVRVVAAVARDVALADAVFTLTAAIAQPVTGLLLVLIAHYPLATPWIAAALGLYLLVGCCWVPVVWLQLRMRDMAVAAAGASSELPSQYRRYYRCWIALGWPAFFGVLVLFYLMIAKPQW